MELPPVLFEESCVFTCLFVFRDFCQQQTHLKRRVGVYSSLYSQKVPVSRLVGAGGADCSKFS